MTIITYSILCLLSILLSASVVADQCSQSCAYIAPMTLPLTNASCAATGDSSGDIPFITRINWSDGSLSDISVRVDLQLHIGSCCTDISYNSYLNGVVTNGRFIGEKVIAVINQQSVRQTCNGCATNSGLSRLYGPILLSIGTKGVGKWIECVGNVTSLYSPAIIASTFRETYTSISADFICNDCVESC